MTVYGLHNAKGARVYDVDTKAEIRGVIEVNTGTGAVTCFKYPLRVDPTGLNAEAETQKFQSIHAIYGGQCMPCLIHCYGRVPETA